MRWFVFACVYCCTGCAIVVESITEDLAANLSNAILEAMAAGLPVIAPDSGGNSEVVTHKTGILFKTGDADGLAQAIIRLLGDRIQRLAMGKHGISLARSKFSLEAMTHSYERLFVTEIKKVEQSSIRAGRA